MVLCSKLWYYLFYTAGIHNQRFALRVNSNNSWSKFDWFDELFLHIQCVLFFCRLIGKLLLWTFLTNLFEIGTTLHELFWIKLKPNSTWFWNPTNVFVVTEVLDLTVVIDSSSYLDVSWQSLLAVTMWCNQHKLHVNSVLRCTQFWTWCIDINKNALLMWIVLRVLDCDPPRPSVWCNIGYG